MADERNWLIDHTGIGVCNIHRSARFYEAALRPLGVKILKRITRAFGAVEQAASPTATAGITSFFINVASSDFRNAKKW